MNYIRSIVVFTVLSFGMNVSAAGALKQTFSGVHTSLEAVANSKFFDSMREHAYKHCLKYFALGTISSVIGVATIRWMYAQNQELKNRLSEAEISLEQSKSNKKSSTLAKIVATLASGGALSTLLVSTFDKFSKPLKERLGLSSKSKFSES